MGPTVTRPVQDPLALVILDTLQSCTLPFSWANPPKFIQTLLPYVKRFGCFLVMSFNLKTKN